MSNLGNQSTGSLLITINPRQRCHKLDARKLISQQFPSASIPNCHQVITHKRVRSNPTEINGLSNQWLIDYPS